MAEESRKRPKPLSGEREHRAYVCDGTNETPKPEEKSFVTLLANSSIISKEEMERY